MNFIPVLAKKLFIPFVAIYVLNSLYSKLQKDMQLVVESLRECDDLSILL